MTTVIRRRPQPVFLPIVLVLSGTMLLLWNLDALPAGAGWRLLEVSPLILVMLGLQIVLGRSAAGHGTGVLALALIGVIGLAGFAFVALGPAVGSGQYVTYTSSSPAAGVGAGTLRIDGAGTQVSVIFADTQSDLYRAQIRYAGDAPQLNYSGGDLHLGTPNRAGLGWGMQPDQYRLTLSSSVPWTIVVNGAGITTSVEVGAGRLLGFALNGVGSSVDLSPGTPDGTVPIELNGLATRLTVAFPAGVQYRVRADGLFATTQGPTSSGAWAGTSDRYDVSAAGLAVRVEVRSGAPTGGL